MITEEMLVKSINELDDAIINSLPDPSECKHVFSLSFEKKIKKLIHKAKYYSVYTALKRVACVFICILVSMSLFLAFNPEARAAIVDWVEEKVEDFYHYFFIGETEPNETVNSAPADGTEETVVQGEPKAYYLSWVPEGYMELDSFEEPNGKSYIYLDNQGNILQFTYLRGTSSDALMVGGGEYERKLISDSDFYAEVFLALEQGETNAIIWKDEEDSVIFSITGYFAEDDLIKMAKNLAVKENN